MDITLADICGKTHITFRYKGRRWYCNAYIPWLRKCEIHTLTGDRCTTLEPTYRPEHIEIRIV